MSQQGMKGVLGLLLVGLASLSINAAEVRIVAHRGASRDAPENTLPAFRLAWEQGADAIEGDFHLSKDGKIVCIHDRNTEKVSGINWVVRDTTLAELRQLDVGKHHSAEYEGIGIPTLSEVFATVPEGKKIYVEIKSGPSLVPKLLEEIEQSKLHNEQIVVISFDKNVIQAIKSEAPQFKAYWLSSFKETRSGKKVPSAKTVLNTLKKTRADGFSSNKDGVSEALIEKIREKGFEYHVWTVDDPETAHRFRNWGALSITTNVPGLLRKSLSESDVTPTDQGR